MNKFELVRNVLRTDIARRGLDRPKVLDVGCRDCSLRSYIDEFTDYEGLDQFQNKAGTVTHVLDMSKGLRFVDGSYDYVIALDVLEHLDDFDHGLSELTRISRSGLIVMLPNVAHIVFRLRFLRTGLLANKYDLVYGQGKDRHRWVTAQNQCDEYMRKFSEANGLSLKLTWYNDTRKKRYFALACRALGVSPQLWVWASLYMLGRQFSDAKSSMSAPYLPRG